MPLILVQGMSLWCLIMKRKEIIVWIHLCPNLQMNFDSKKLWEQKLCKWNQSINVIYPNGVNEFMMPNHGKNEFTIWICVCPNWQININSKKWHKEEFFIWNLSINVIYPNEEIEFTVPNHEKKRVTMWIHACSNWKINFNS